MAKVDHEIQIDAPPEAVFDLFRDPDTFVEIVGHLQDAFRDGDSIEWVAQGPLGVKLTGEAEILQEDRPSRLAWRSTSGALDVTGTADFTAADGGTCLRYCLNLDVPGGFVGNAVAATLGDADGEVRRTLERLKALAET